MTVIVQNWQDLQEAVSLAGAYVDTRDAYRDEDGTEWLPLAMGGALDPQIKVGFCNELDLANARQVSRYIAARSPYAINAMKNMANFVVGCGHTYKAVSKKGATASEELLAAVQQFLAEFCEVNKWRKRQQESVKRVDRDGEVFRRLFKHGDGILRVRSVEPGQVATPTQHATSPNHSFGIETDPEDVETPVNYWIDGKPVPADEVQHIKPTVDLNVKRGAPTFFVCADTLIQTKKIRRNMAIGSSMQTSVAYVKKIKNASAAGVNAARSNAADTMVHNGRTGQTDYYQQHRPGKVILTSDAVDYDFPFSGVNYSQYVDVIADNLREFASLMNMPEAMLTADASRMAAYTAAMVAESPSARNFEAMQHDWIEEDLQVIWAAIAWAIECGRLPANVPESVEVQATPPSVAVRNKLEETQIAEVESRAGILSPQSWSARSGLDYDQEQKNIEDHKVRVPEAALSPLGSVGDEEEEDEEDQGDETKKDEDKKQPNEKKETDDETT